MVIFDLPLALKQPSKYVITERNRSLQLAHVCFFKGMKENNCQQGFSKMMHKKKENLLKKDFERHAKSKSSKEGVFWKHAFLVIQKRLSGI